MNIVIVGAGEVGRSVAKTLSDEGHNIYLVEKDEAQAKSIDEELDVQVIRGNGARPQVLAQAGVTQSGDVDILIACTNRDEVNMLSCWIAHSAGVPNVISRARNLEFTDSADWGKKLGIDAMISPERSIAREIISLLEVSSAMHAAELLDGRAAIYTLRISEESPLVNMALKDLRAKWPDLIAVFVHVEHGLTLVQLLPLFGGDFLVFYFNAVFLSEEFQGLDVGQLFYLHDEMHGISALAAGKALADAFGRGNME